MSIRDIGNRISIRRFWSVARVPRRRACKLDSWSQAVRRTPNRLRLAAGRIRRGRA